MQAARVLAGRIEEYPYLLRPRAKRLHPEVSPLPGSWDQCTPEQMAALEAVPVYEVPRPAAGPGYSAVELPPEPLPSGGFLQRWELVGETPEPDDPLEMLNAFTFDTLPEPATHFRAIGLCVDEANGPLPVWCDGKDWRRFDGTLARTK